MRENANKIALTNKLKGTNALVIFLGETPKEKKTNNSWS